NGNYPRSFAMSRPAFETLLRRMIHSTCPNVRYVAGNVTDLVVDHSTHQSNVVSAVNVRAFRGEEQTIQASLVVDCTGLQKGGLRWLKASSANFTVPHECSPLNELQISYDHKMAYTTCEFDVPERLFVPLRQLGFPGDYMTAAKLYVHLPLPAVDNRYMVLDRCERNYLRLMCGGWNVRDRITSYSDIKAFFGNVKQLQPMPSWILDMFDLFEAEDVPVSYHHLPPSSYIRYDLAKCLPSNFIALGDSYMLLNPVAG
ncbi:hypothetical protein BU17DRAFT_43743, partial [Hysterangium stoloniferum]